MNESEYGPRPTRRAGIAIAALLGCILALLPMTAAHAVPVLGLSVTSPTLEEDFTLGETVTITWSTNATVPLNIELWDSTGSSKVMDIKAGVAAKPSTYKWSIPMNDSTLNGVVPGQFRVRISTASGPVKVDFSDDPFNIGYGAITVTSPKATDSWKGGDVGRVVKFDPQTATGALAADLMDAAGTGVVIPDIKTGIQATAKQFTWDIPVGVASAPANYRIRLRSANANVKGLSPAGFTLGPPTIHVTQPDAGGLTWAVGATQTVKWTAPFPGSVTIKLVDLVTPGLTATLSTTTSAKTGTFSFLLPAATALGSGRYKVSVTSNSNANVTDSSDNAFDIANPTVAVTNPNGSTLNTGERVAVKWTTQAVGKVRLELLDSGNNSIYNITPPTGIASVTTGTNTYNWDIPLGVTTASGTHKIRATVVGQSFSGMSSFTLNVPTITLVDPSNTGWDVGTQHTISWSTSSTFTGSVSLQLLNSPSLTLGAVIKATLPVRPNTLTWVVPHNLAPGSYVIRIASAGVGAALNTQVKDDSAAFTVGLPAVTVTPAGTPWTVGTRQTINYTTPATGNLKFELLDSGNAVVGSVKASAPASGTSFTWDIPLGIVTATGTYKVKATSTAVGGSQITGVSGGFTINVPTITVTVPTNNAAWTSPMAAQTITWTGFTTGSVKITLVKSGVTTVLKASVLAAPGTTTAAVPSGLSSGTYDLVVTSTSNPGITGLTHIVI